MKMRIKQLLLLMFMLLLLLPGIQFKTSFVNVRSLGGDYQFAGKPEFTFNDFLLKHYQNKYEQYVNDQIGFREILLRTYNQTWFSLFRVLHARDVVMGKNNCLYELNYIYDYTGANFKGEDVIDEQLRKAKFLQDTLAKSNIHLVFFFAPGKASFYPENIPEKFLKKAQPHSNYKCYVEKCKTMGINHIDMNAYFVKLKKKTDYPIYSHLGIHWTVYGMTLAVDSLLHYMGELQHAPLPGMVVDSIELSDIPRDTDNDLEKGLNLLLDLPRPVFAYPAFHFVESPGTHKPSVLTIGDSYWWNFYGQGHTLKVFNGSSFWFYNEIAYFDDGRPEASVPSLDIREECSKHEFIILLATESSLHRFTWGFIETLYDVYTGHYLSPAQRQAIEEEIQFQQAVIRNNPGWFRLVQEKAAQSGLPVDTVLRKDAIWMVNNKRTAS